MAPLAATLHRWTAPQTRAQFAAVAALRWHIFRNNLRRRGNIGDLIALCIMLPLFLAFTLVPSVIAGFLSDYSIVSGHTVYIAFLLWGIFALCQLSSIQLGQPDTTFDPTQLIRFPLSFRGYTFLRIFFGLLSPANILGTLAALAIAIGVSAADLRLAPCAFAALGAFALVNIFFTRMVFSWVDRWLSTRRAREVFTGIIFVVSLSIQYANFTFNPAFRHHDHDPAVLARRIALLTSIYHSAKPFLALTPPGLAANAIAAGQNGHAFGIALNVLGELLYAALFFSIFAIRLYKEFRGENLSEAATAVAPTPRRARLPALVTARSAMQLESPPTVSATFAKELLYMRRNSGIFYAVLAPLVMVILFVSRMSLRLAPGMMFASAVGYTLLGIVPISFNSLGLEAAGVQFYFLAPIRMRDVFFAKNLMHFALAFLEIIAVLITVVLAGKAPSPPLLAAVLLWAIFTMCVILSIGNIRSITAPKKMDPRKMQSRQAAPLSALISMGLLIGCSLVGTLALYITKALARPWLLPPVALMLAVIGVVVYFRSLAHLDGTVARHRDTLCEELCKAS